MLVHDSVTGLLEGSAAPGRPLLRFAVPVADVTHVEEFRYNSRRTIMLIALPIVGSAYGLFLAAL